jgi:proteasome lid subunit RPN8/RPN11
VIELPAGLVEAIRRHGAETYPEECCGGLLGERRNGTVRVVRTEPVPNRQTELRQRRYTIDPLDYLRLERLAGEVGLSVVGIYHSHPDHPAVPSEFDREHALPYFHYLIVAVEEGRAGDFACWVLSEDRKSFGRAPHRLDHDDDHDHGEE